MNENRAHEIVQSVAWGVIAGTAIVAAFGAVYYVFGADLRRFNSENRILAIVGFAVYPFFAQFIYRRQRRLRGLSENPSLLDWAWWGGSFIPWLFVVTLMVLADDT